MPVGGGGGGTHGDVCLSPTIVYPCQYLPLLRVALFLCSSYLSFNSTYAFLLLILVTPLLSDLHASFVFCFISDFYFLFILLLCFCSCLCALAPSALVFISPATIDTMDLRVFLVFGLPLSPPVTTVSSINTSQYL